MEATRIPAAQPDRSLTNEPKSDLELVKEILAASEEAWSRFILTYSGLIYAVIRRYLYIKDEDDVRSVFVDVLDHLYRSKLATYEGRSSLSTWLVLVTRTETLDFLRRRFGRRELPKGLKKLAKLDQHIFRLYYVEGLHFSLVLHRLAQEGSPFTPSGLLGALQRIEEAIDNRALKRIAYDLHAQSVGAASGRLIEFLDHVKVEFELSQEASSPEYRIMEREARRTLEQIGRLLQRLSPEEREVLSLRFEAGWNARRIAEELGIANQRGVYTVLDRLFRRLRRHIGENA